MYLLYSPIILPRSPAQIIFHPQANHGSVHSAEGQGARLRKTGRQVRVRSDRGENMDTGPRLTI